MSGETEDNVSSWTVDTLHAHVERIVPLLQANTKSELAVRDQRISSELAIRDERLTAMDKATNVLDQTIHRVPTDLQESIGHLKELMDVQLHTIAEQFAEFDKRLIRDLAANSLQVTAAFVANKELSISQGAANQEAIKKSESATAASITGLGDKIEDDRKRMTRIEDAIVAVNLLVVSASQNRVGNGEAVADRRAINAGIFGAVGTVVGVIGVILAIVVFVTTRV